MKKGYKIIFIRPGNSITDISKDTIIVFMTWNKKNLFFVLPSGNGTITNYVHIVFVYFYIGTYIPNKFAYLQSESNCKLPRIRPSWYAA